MRRWRRRSWRAAAGDDDGGAKAGGWGDAGYDGEAYGLGDQGEGDEDSGKDFDPWVEHPFAEVGRCFGGGVGHFLSLGARRGGTCLAGGQVSGRALL